MIHFYRIACWLYLRRIPLLPRMIYIFNRILFSVVLPPSAAVGRNVTFGYSDLAIVVHKRAQIGDNVVVLHDVPAGAVALGIPARIKSVAREACQ